MELATLGNRLLVLAQQLGAGESAQPAQVPPEVREKMSRRECLQDGVIVPASQRYRRGLCPACYQRTKNRMLRGQVTEETLIAKGWIAAESQKGGRKTTSADPVGDMLNEVRVGAAGTMEEIAHEGLAVSLKKSGRKPGRKKEK